MALYYGVVRSEEELYHYGVIGMHWGVRKKALQEKHKQRKQERENRKFENSIYAKSRSTQHQGHGGFLSGAIAGNDKNSPHTQALVRKWNAEYDAFKERSGGLEMNDKQLRAYANKYKSAYVDAILRDAKIPVNKKNRKRATAVLRKVDDSFDYYYNY